MPSGPDDAADILHCRSCSTRLAHDQRYCVACGERRRPLPTHIVQLIAAIRERGLRVATPAQPQAEPLVTRPAWYDGWLRAPRAAAVAVMGALAFGALVGSMAAGSDAGTAQQVVVALAPHGTTPAAPATAGGGSGGGSSGSGGPATITVTTPAPSTPAGSSGGSSNTASTTPTTTTTASSTLPPVKHVFLIVLSNEGFNQTFGHTNLDPYLGKTLVRQGELLPNYYAVASGPLANEIAMVSGQGPTPQTAQNCPQYKKIEPGVPGPDDQLLGSGCVYPNTTDSLVSQLATAKKTWRVYVEDKNPSTQAKLEMCRPALGTSNPWPSVKAPYESFRNPFLYLASTPGKSACDKNYVGLGSLDQDLASAATTPAFSYIVPNLCNEGAVSCNPAVASPMAAADDFLRSVVPAIKRSPAYKDGGVIAITFDQAQQSGPNADSSSCCGNPTYPNDPAQSSPPSGTTTTTGTDTTTTGTGTTTTGTTTTGTTTTGTTTTGTTTTGTTTTGTTTTTQSLGSGVTNPTGGGGQVGLLLISPFVTAGTEDVTDYFNHYSLLGSLEDVFGLTRLGYAASTSLPVFGAAVWTNYSGG